MNRRGKILLRERFAEEAGAVSRHAGMHMRSCATVGPKSIAAADAIFRTQHKDASPPLAAHGKAATKPRFPVSGIFDGNAYAVFISCIDRNGM
jgi:hypothetical protein